MRGFTRLSFPCKPLWSEISVGTRRILQKTDTSISLMSHSSSCQEVLKTCIYSLLKITFCLFHPDKNVPTVFSSEKIIEICKLESVERDL